MISDLVEPNNLRLLFGAGGVVADVVDDLREDLSFLAILARAVFMPAALRPAVRVQEVFPPFVHHALPQLRNKKIGLVASGGSGALASLCGVRRACEEADVPVAAISACSGATLFATLWAMGLSGEEMADFWLSLRTEDYVDADWSRLLKAGLRGFRDFGGLMRGEAVERAFRRRFGAATLADTKIPLYAVVWNIDRNRIEYFGSKTTPRLPVARLARVAISIPLLVEPVRIGRHLYGDGGIVSIFPVRPLIDHEEPLDILLGVNCYHAENFGGEDVTGWREQSWAIARASGQLRYSGHLELAREQMKLAGSRLTMIHPVPYTDVRGAKFYESFLDRSRWPHFMRQGRRSAQKVLRRLAQRRLATHPRRASAAAG